MRSGARVSAAGGAAVSGCCMSTAGCIFRGARWSLHVSPVPVTRPVRLQRDRGVLRNLLFTRWYRDSACTLLVAQRIPTLTLTLALP